MEELKTRLLLYGGSGHASVVLTILKDLNKAPIGFIDDNEQVESFHNLSKFNMENVSNIDEFIIAIGNNLLRKKIAEKLRGNNFGNAFHPTAYINEFCIVNEGTVIMQNATVQINSRIGRHCIVNTGACIDHDCIVGDFCHISPNATLTGNVILGEGTWIGAGAVILPGLKIGSWCVIGAGSVVTRDIGDCEVVLGVPARRVINRLPNE